jgi:hypothetical protein
MRGTRRIPARTSDRSPAASRIARVSTTSRADTGRFCASPRTLAPGASFAHDPSVLLFYLLPRAPDILVLLTLAVALYLTVIELRELEPRPHWKWWGWWLSLVFLTHFIGYLALRGYAFYRRWQRARA